MTTPPTALLLILLTLGNFLLPEASAQPSDSTTTGCMTCEELNNLYLPDVTITQASPVDEGTLYCQVLGLIGTEIKFELLLPEQWNARFVMGGGGGTVGTIQNGARESVHDGYATSGTDTGHEGNGLTSEWAYLEPERQLNYGYLAVHRTAEVSQAIIREYYCAAPEYRYFVGCSRGGGQALIEAQRYPDDFDGIVSAAPVIDFPATTAEFIQNTQYMYPDPEQLDQPLLSAEQLDLLENTVLAQCDELDGVKDRILNDPRECDFDFTELPACPDGQAGNDCFTPDQIEAIQKVYEGVSNEHGEIYPGFPVGAEGEPKSWQAWIVGPHERAQELGSPSLQHGFGTGMYKYFVFQNPDWDYSDYDFTDLQQDSRYASALLNATSTDYRAFQEQGGKMIMYHGWNDPALSAYTSIEHYEQAREKDPQLDEYIRLFLLPGVLHCGGGPGPSTADWLQLIRQWVEDDEAPERVVVAKVEEGQVVMTRPVFPYPRKAVYDGEGDPRQESSFKSDN